MIFVEDRLVKVGGVVLPGLLKSIEVTETAKVDEQEVEGSAVKPKQATGYEDARVNIELILDDTAAATKYQRLEAIRTAFRKPGQKVPQPISIVCEDTAAHGIEKVIFKNMRHKRENKKDQLSVTLEFWEFIPQTIKTKKGGGGSKSSSASNKRASKQASKQASEELSADYKNYLSKGRGKSPAVDDAPTSEAMNRVQQMPY